MTISRMQQSRQMYGLGSIVKKITKGIKSGVKGITGAVKDNPLLAIAALNFAPMLVPGGASTFLGGKNAMFGLSNLLQGGIDKLGLGVAEGAKPTFGQMAKVFGIGSLGGAALDALSAGGVDDPKQIKDIATLKMQLANGYKLLNPDADQDEIDTFVQNNIPVQNKAYGGRIGYAFGNDPEQNAIQASGIMGLPLNENPAGATELDLRETGGFIPPVGVKEKEDDIPAMLSNNEFVFTADAVRGMGDGNVNKGAQRMYDMMKKLEKGGRV